ncbi:MAG: CocE/NonD family hydrolase [Gemmatimonadales bacterium]
MSTLLRPGILLAGLTLWPALAQAQPRVSRPGAYQGYSTEQYDGYQRSSLYLTMRDGVRLAADIIRPTKGGVLHQERLPVVWAHHRYHRATIVNGALRTTFGEMALLLKYGYVLAVVDARGAGASFGHTPGFYATEERRDTYEVTEWLARQPWSTGKVGMWGRSYLGHIQYYAAAERPPSLKAIFPEMATFDWFDDFNPGGIFHEYALPTWRFLTKNLDESKTFEWYGVPFGPVAPVDGDSGEALRAAAIRDHDGNLDVGELFRDSPYRNSVEPRTGERLYQARSVASHRRDISASGIGIYHMNGWLDEPRQAVMLYRNLATPRKLVIGPWYHTQSRGFDNQVEHLRWYDYWLKGIDNGIMREPPIYYATFNAPPDSVWQWASTWPLPTERRIKHYFGPGPSGSIQSRNDGSLAPVRPKGPGADEQTIDTSTTSGRANRWTVGYGHPPGYPDMAPNDAKGWTYTTAPLRERVLVTGHPVARLWVTADTTDADFFVYLEEVEPSGKSNFVTDGLIRAARSRLGTAPYDKFGLPYLRQSSDDPPVRLSPSKPTELVIELLPTSIYFRPGNRIRVTITGRDHLNFPGSPRASRVTILRSATYPSHIELPVISQTTR